MILRSNLPKYSFVFMAITTLFALILWGMNSIFSSKPAELGYIFLSSSLLVMTVLVIATLNRPSKKFVHLRIFTFVQLVLVVSHPYFQSIEVIPLLLIPGETLSMLEVFTINIFLGSIFSGPDPLDT